MFTEALPSSGYNALRVAIDPNDPDYLKKMGMANAIEGHHELVQDKMNPPEVQNAAPASAMNEGILGAVPQPLGGGEIDKSLIPRPAPEAQPEQHSLLGRIGLGVGKALMGAGNVAGDILAPGTMALIPGTQLHQAEQQRAYQAQQNIVAQRQMESERLANEAANRQELSRIAQENAESKKTTAETGAKAQTSLADYRRFQTENASRRTDLAQSVVQSENLFRQGKLTEGAQSLDLAATKLDEYYKLAQEKFGDEEARTELMAQGMGIKNAMLQLQQLALAQRGTAAGVAAEQKLATLKAAHPILDLFGEVGGEQTLEQATPFPGATTPTEPAKPRVATPAKGGAPKVGTVENGYRFKGGDPSKQSNWEKVK